MPNMIFHYPGTIVDNGKSGSQIRPHHMREAFIEIGYTIYEVAGTASQRRAAIERIKRAYASGVKFDIMYSESTSMPTLLSESHHMPLHPRLDFGLMRWCKQHNIPTALFYRDVYWRFDAYRKQTSLLKRLVAIPFYRYDLHQYRKHVKHFYLPSFRMNAYLPGVKRSDSRMLPPAHNIENATAPVKSNTLRLLYVGGITPPFYDLRPATQATRNLEGVRLTICCRADEWDRMRSIYGIDDAENIQVVHLSGDDLDELYRNSDVFMMVREKDEYINFAMPVKLFEAIGHGKPIITTRGTAAASFIQDNKIGWVLEPDTTEIADLLVKLHTNKPEVERVAEHVKEVRRSHTWQKRARQVIQRIL